MIYFRKNKYRAKSANGFGSRLENAVYQRLKDRETIGLISDIKRQQIVVLQDGPREMRITWRVDFSFLDKEKNETVYAEAKGIETSDYKLKLKIWRKLKPAKLEIWKGTYKNPKLVEVIEN